MPRKRPERYWRRMEQDILAATASSLIRTLMERKRVSRKELARRMRKSLPDITQLLRPTRNLTLHTLAALAWTMGARIRLQIAHKFSTRVKVRVPKRRKMR